ncbi:hypothetical protein [Acetobacter sp. P5B1]|nr:hypothetical protein [Acetobacter sp. P5B1]
MAADPGSRLPSTAQMAGGCRRAESDLQSGLSVTAQPGLSGRCG